MVPRGRDGDAGVHQCDAAGERNSDRKDIRLSGSLTTSIVHVAISFANSCPAKQPRNESLWKKVSANSYRLIWYHVLLVGCKTLQRLQRFQCAHTGHEYNEFLLLAKCAFHDMWRAVRTDCGMIVKTPVTPANHTLGNFITRVTGYLCGLNNRNAIIDGSKLCCICGDFADAGPACAWACATCRVLATDVITT